MPSYHARQIQISYVLPDVRRFVTSDADPVEIEFWVPPGRDLAFDKVGKGPMPQALAIVKGRERHFWVEFNGPFRRRPALRDVAGRDLRSAKPVGITTDDGRQYLFLDDPDTPRDVIAAFPTGAFRALRVAQQGQEHDGGDDSDEQQP